MSVEIDTFIQTLKTLSSLKDVAHPQAETLDENPVWRSAVARQVKAIDPSKRDTYWATMVMALPIVLAFTHGASRSFTSLEKRDTTGVVTDPIEIVPPDLRDAIAAAQEDLTEGATGKADLQMTSEANGDITLKFEDPAIRYHFWEAIHELEKGVATPTHAALLMRSILTMGVSAFEVLVGNLYRSFLLCHPASAENPDAKSFSLNDLFDFGSVQDAIDESIFQQSDSFTRKGLRAWTSWFKAKPLEVDLAALSYDWLRSQEIFERRNVVIHNGSRVTRQYLNNVDRSLASNLVEGSPLEITPDYVDEALERLLTLGTLLAYKVRLKLFRRDNLTAISDWIAEEQFNFLMGSHFHAVSKIAGCTLDDDLVASNQVLLRINGWISRMRTNGPKACADEIETWDTTALSDRFRVAQLVLLRKDERALAALKEAIDKEEFTVEHLREWPLFHWMREDGLLKDLIEDAGNDITETVDVVVAAESTPSIEPLDATGIEQQPNPPESP